MYNFVLAIHNKSTSLADTEYQQDKNVHQFNQPSRTYRLPDEYSTKLSNGVILKRFFNLFDAKQYTGQILFAMTYIGYIVLYSARKPFSIVKPYIREDLNISLLVLSLFDTVFLASYAIGQIFLAKFLEQVQVHLILLAIFGCSGITSYLISLSANPTYFAIVWSLAGFSHAAAFPLMIRALTSHFPASKRGRALSIWTTSQHVGALVSSAIAAQIVQRYGWRLTFLFPAMSCSTTGILLYIFVPSVITTSAPQPNETCLSTSNSYNTHPENLIQDETSVGPYWDQIYDFTSNETTKRVTVSQNNPHKKTVSTPRSSSTSPTCRSRGPRAIEQNSNKIAPTSNSQYAFMKLIAIPNLLLVGLAYFFVKLIRYSLLFWIPYFLVTQFHYSTPQAAYSSAFFDLGGILGAWMSGYIADKFLNGKRILTAGLTSLATSVSVLLFAVATHVGIQWTCASMVLLGFFVGGTDSILGSCAAQDLCEKAGLGPEAFAGASSIVNGIGSLGSVLQAYVTAEISSRFGWDILHVIFCLFSTFSAFLLFISVRRDVDFLGSAITQTNSRHYP